jgi:zinc protease
MKTIIILRITTILGIAISLCAAQSIAPAKPASKSSPATQTKTSIIPVTTYDRIKAPKLPEFHPQLPERFVLPNGMVIFLQVDHELPIIDGFARIRGGSRDVPVAKAGLMDLYGDVWRTGGTKSKTGDELDDFLEARAAKVEADAGLDSTALSFACLKNDFDSVFQAFVDVLRNPEFRENKLELTRQQMMTAISRRNEDVDGIASREAQKIGYGADSPYARVPEYWTVAAVTRQDLIDWHKHHVAPKNIILGISGDFDAAKMKVQLTALFADWQAGVRTEPTAVMIPAPKPGIYFANKEDVNQSQIQIVAAGIRRDDPDFFAVRVLNEVLSGGFASRLIKELRTRQGLAYSVDGGIESAWDHPGLLRLSMGTKSESTVKAVQGMKAEMERLFKEPPTDKEIQQAKDQILNSFIFRFDSKDKILQEEMLYEYYGFPLDYLDKYRVNIEKITATDVSRAAKRLVETNKFAVLVVGNEKEFTTPLTTLGPITKVDITIPETPPSKLQ